MKYFFASLLLLTVSFVKAQTVNIPDSNFKAALIDLGIDTNNDGEIQQGEADVVTDMPIPLLSQDTIKDLTGILFFQNLEKLDCSYQGLTTLDVSGLARLQRVLLPEKLVSLNVSNCTNLDGLDLMYASVLTTLNAENCSRLKSIDISGLGFYGGVAITLVNCDSLVSIIPGGGAIRVLNISESDRISSVIYSPGTEKIIARNCLALTQISPDLSGTNLRGVDVTGCRNLETLSIGEALVMDDIDLSTCPNIKNLFVSAAMITDRCLSINLKNGTRMQNCRIALIGSDSGLPTCVNICVDDFEMDSVPNWLHFVDGFGAELVNINSYCNFTPAASYNSIKGKVMVSQTSTCDITSRGIPNVPIVITGSAGTIMKFTDTPGGYNHYFYTGNFTISPYFAYPYFNISPATASVSFDTANSIIETRDFCIIPNGTHNDLEISFLPAWPPARPGFNAAYTITYKNRGTTTLSGSVQLNFDNNKMNFVSASENVATQSTGQLTWNYNNLQPFESKTINVTFNLLPPPVNNIGDTINYLAAITPSAGDETQFDNTFILPQRVTGSYDPNDKQCLEGSKLDISQIGDYLHYQIRFQNEGTDTAFNVVVADTLSDKLDWNTFEFIKASHTADVRLTNNRLEFFFQNINLPYKAINEPASNGWVAFKIKPKPSVVIGDSLNNSAAIYFDFNLPVITNTATTIVSNSSSPVPVKLEYFSINKKESSNQLNWKASCTSTRATFVIERSDDGIHPIAIGFKSIGNISATALRCQLPFNFTDNNPINGKNYYRIKITDAEGKSFYSKVLVAGNNKAGIEITAVANNTVYISSNKQQTLTMKVIAGDGKEIMNAKQYIPAGNNTIGLKIGKAAKGIYTLVVYTDDNIISKKFVQ